MRQFNEDVIVVAVIIGLATVLWLVFMAGFIWLEI